MNVMSRTATLAVALALTVGLLAFACVGDDVQAADAPDLGDAPTIGADFDWDTLSAGTEYKITDKVTIGAGEDVTIPETAVIHILEGGSLTFEDCTLSLLGTVHAWAGSEVVVSSTAIEMDGAVIAEAGSTVTLKIDSAGGQTYRAIAPEAADDVIIALSEGYVSFSETMVDLNEGWLFDIDGKATFDMIDTLPINTYEVLVQEGAELGIVGDVSEEGIITNHGTIAIAAGVTVDHAGYGFENTGTIINEGSVSIQYDTVENTGTITNNGTVTATGSAEVNNGGILNGNGLWNAEVSGEGTVESGIFSADVSSMLAEGSSVHSYSGLNVVTVDTESPAIVIAGIPFGTLADAAGLINVAGDFVTVSGSTITFVEDLTDTSGVTLAIPEGSDVTIDLNGHDVVLGVITVNGGLAVNDTVGEGSLSTTNVIVEGGDLSGDGTIVGSSDDDLIDIFDSGSVTGITIDITAVTGGAVTVNVGVTGAVEVSGITVLIRNAESVVDRGIFVNPTLEGGSVEVSDVTFDFNGNDSCPFNADVDGTTVLSVSDFTYIDAARSNKALFNAVGDVTIGSEGGLDIARVSDVVLWDASGEGNSFTVEGDLVADGRITVTTGGGLVIPDGSTMVVNRTITVTSDASISGKLLFGSDRTNAISLDGVVAGDSGLTMSLGSVVLSGQVSEGTLTLDGSGAVEDELDLGQAVLAVPAGSQLYVAADAVIIGETGLSVMGEVSVFGTVSAPVVNGGSVKVYGDGQVTGDVSGNEVETPEDPIEVSISHISDVTITLGNELRVAVTVFPGDARITASAGEVVLDVDGRVISWTPDEAGTYTVTVTAEYDGQVDTTTFKVTVNEPATDDPEDGWDIDWRYVLIAIVLIVMIVILVARFL